MSLQPTRTKEQIQALREGGQILGQILSDLEKIVVPGMTGIEVDNWVKQQINNYGATPTYYEPEVDFPGVICISPNDMVVHGIPNQNEFNKGDLISFDLVITYHGMRTDSAFTMLVGEKPTGATKHLITQTKQALQAGIDQARAGHRVGQVSNAIEKVLKKAKLGIVRELVGHGVGEKIHMPPEVPNYGQKDSGPILSVGDIIAIEPMTTLGNPALRFDSNGWDIYIKDGSIASHFEHTVLITESEPEIITKKD